ncbi:MAG: sensor hybrid histidine kinase, partial [Verrucomicrobiaceae bacterium]|nr:sensor hybrid histidine kinase [Verrucomicrobiaceae bacterium]
EPGPYVVISVQDTGSGMRPEVLARAVEPFFTTKPVGKGTGLGLSSTLAIVKSHGGFVSVWTEEGRGTKFSVYMPAISATAADSQPRIENDLPRGEDELVLLIDDEAAVRDITRHILENFGYRVLTACNGIEATRLYPLHKDKIAVVITDMMMPVMDGPATIHALRQMNPEVRIIAVSGMSSHAVVASTLAAGARHFLAKPYTSEALLQALRQVLAKPGLAGVLQTA